MDGRSIRAIREELGLSQERFAQSLSVSLQSVRRWESGVTRPLPVISVKLAQLRREAGGRERRSNNPMPDTRDRGAELGLGGLFKGFGSLLDLVSKMAEEGAGESTRSDQFEGMEGRLKGVYGLSVRLGLGGKPVIEQFGNIRETQGGPVVAEVRQPLIDVLDEDGFIVVVAELPGVEHQHVTLSLEGDVLTIAAETGRRKYRGEALLPAAVDAASLEQAYRNGILEVRLRKQAQGGPR